jgi:hypothetical protein
MNENIENISVHSDNVVNTVNVNNWNDTIDTSYSSLTESPLPDSLNILSLNCCGIKKRLQYPEFEDLLRNHDIICLVESKTDDRDEIKLTGYIFTSIVNLISRLLWMLLKIMPEGGKREK